MAQSVMPGSVIYAQEATQFSDDEKSDHVIANHVIHYFSSLDYAQRVLDKMLRKATKTVYISGIPNAEYRAESECERRGLLSPKEYEAKYAGLEILYFYWTFFADLAKKHNAYTVDFFTHDMPGFAQNRFRFDALFKK